MQARADIHDGPEHNARQSEAGYDARPQSPQIDEILLQLPDYQGCQHQGGVIFQK